MAKEMEAIIGIGIAVALFLLIPLGIKAFYPPPEYADCSSMYYDAAARSACVEQYKEDLNSYNKNVFIIANLLGIVCVFVSIFLINTRNIAAGVAFAGIVTIFYGFVKGWNSAGDIAKFLVALFVAIVLIGAGVWANKNFKKIMKKK